MKTTEYEVTKVERLPESEVRLSATISADAFARAYESTVNAIVRDAELPGFRKGKAPREAVVGRVGDAYILSEAAERAIGTYISRMIDAEKLRVIGTPSVSVISLTKDAPLVIEATVAVIPDVTLPDYVSLGKKARAGAQSTEVTDAEVEAALLDIRKRVHHARQHEAGVAHAHGEETKEEDLPALTDEFAQSIGPFPTVDALTLAAREELGKEKERKEKERVRAAIVDGLVDGTKCEVPRMLIENELDIMFAQFEGDISRSGLTLDAYLEHAKKTRDEVREEWRETARKKVTVQLAVAAIAEKEKIAPDAEKVRTESEKILILHSDADPVRVRSYVASQLTNEAVFAFLEQ